jgi:small-conductance mechanosensitive channel
MPIENAMLNRLNPLAWPLDWEAFGAAAAIAGVAVLVSLVLHHLLFRLFAKMARMSETPLDDQIVKHTRRPVRWVLVMVALGLAAQLDAGLAAVWQPIARFLHPALLGWIAYILVKVATEMLEYRLDAADPVQVRGRRTRLSILSRTATAVIVIITLGLMLFALPGVRDIGTTLLASAGLAALAVGAAAQPALKSLIAGVQMAVNEPIRLGDLVVVDGHTGRVEEIHMSYVIVRTWDERAVIVPTSTFLEQTFENWSRKNEKLTGPVFLRLHPESDVARIRAEFEAFLKSQPTWDGRTGSLFVTEAYIDNIELRLAVSAATIADLFTLRCAVREHMIAWLRAEMPDALARATPAPPVDSVAPPNA